MSLKPCLNLCSPRWLNPNRDFLNKFILTESLILKVSLWAGLVSFNDVLWNRLLNRLKYSDLEESILNWLTCSRELLIDGSESIIVGWLTRWLSCLPKKLWNRTVFIVRVALIWIPFLLTFHLKKPLPGVPNQFTIEIILLKH